MKRISEGKNRTDAGMAKKKQKERRKLVEMMNEDRKEERKERRDYMNE